MIISKMIKELEKVKSKYGDLECKVFDSDEGESESEAFICLNSEVNDDITSIIFIDQETRESFR